MMPSHRQLVSFSFVFLFLLSLTTVSAIGIDNKNIPIVRNDPVDFPANFTANISVDSARNWDTLDHGQLDSVSDINHNWLSAIQGGSSGEYYHLNSSINTFLLANIYDWATDTDVDNAVLWEVQPTNSSIVQLKTPRHINMSENDLYVRDIYAANETLYLGDSKLTGGPDGNVHIQNGSMNATYYYGSGQYLTDLNLTDIIINGGNITANYIEAINELVLNNDSINNWSELPQYFVMGDEWIYISNNAFYFNESKLNQSFASQIVSELTNYYNSSEIDNNFIRWDNESSLNVNSSVYWNDMNGINTTVLQNNDGVLDIVMSFFYNLFYTKTEVDTNFVKTQGDSVINGTLNVTNIYADNIDVYNLTAREINAINITAETIDAVNMTVEDLSASTIFARNFTINGTPEGFCLSDGTGCENVSANINGVAPWILFDGENVSFNETKLREEAEVTLQTEVTVVTIAGGTGSATTANVIDFEIKEIDVACNAGMNFRFEASETTSSDVIDRDRKVHTSDWTIEKNYPINDTVDLSITNTNPATGSCTVTIKYLDNFN